jgi:hypothetical protein
MFYGEKGALLLPGGNNYTIFGLDGKVVKEVKDDLKTDARDIANPAQNYDALHIQNFFRAILNGEKLNAGIGSGHKSTLLVQLGNISQRVGRSLNINPGDGHIIADEDAMKYWSREYEKGWEMKF